MENDSGTTRGNEVNKKEARVLAIGAALAAAFCLVLLVVCAVMLGLTGEMSYGLNTLTFLICGGVCSHWAVQFGREASE